MKLRTVWGKHIVTFDGKEYEFDTLHDAFTCIRALTRQ